MRKCAGGGAFQTKGAVSAKALKPDLGHFNEKQVARVAELE